MKRHHIRAVISIVTGRMSKVKTLFLVISAAGCTGALAATNHQDVLGRADSGFSGEEAAYAADPFDPLPQFWGRREIERRVYASTSDSGGAASNARFTFDGTDYYYRADPFDPLPQFWARRNDNSPLRDQNRDVADDGSKKDILGRPYTQLNANDAYYQAAPYDPLPQFWGRREIDRGMAHPSQTATASNLERSQLTEEMFLGSKIVP
jgi:hypothetical protein